MEPFYWCNDKEEMEIHWSVLGQQMPESESEDNEK